MLDAVLMTVCFWFSVLIYNSKTIGVTVTFLYNMNIRLWDIIRRFPFRYYLPSDGSVVFYLL